MSPSPLTDTYHRRLTYLRVSITDRCNLRCRYCIPGDDFTHLPHPDILSYEEIIRILTVGTQLGISKVRITGGEPLVRNGVLGLLERVAGMDGIRDTSLTTNGVLLKRYARRIKDCGIRRINISLDSLKPERYHAICRKDHFQRVWQGIEEALALGFDPIKLNVVALAGINEDELLDFARLTLRYPFHVRFIEYMPMGNTPLMTGNRLLAPQIRELLAPLGVLTPVERGCRDGPAERYRLENGIGEIGIIRPVSHHFCDTCNRLRLTASGQIRPCLLSPLQKDLRGPMRSGCSDAELARLIRSAAALKPGRHQLNDQAPGAVRDQMASIGG